MSAPPLLDANVLIAMVTTDHEHHRRASVWAEQTPAFAVCPIVEGALVRFILRIGGGQSTATSLLTRFIDSPKCEFWGDSLSYTDTDLSHVHGHRQVTDAYLAELASHRGSKLATFDHGLHTALPDKTLLIP